MAEHSTVETVVTEAEATTTGLGSGSPGSPAGDRAPFGVRLAEAVERTGPLCAGIDPSRELMAAWGLDDTPAGLRRFVAVCIEAFGAVAPVVKPQVAFFERFGAAGLEVLEWLVAEAAVADLLVVNDAKRADIGSTMEGYAEAWLADGSPLAGDAVTAVAYLGLGALDPMVERAAATGRGVIVVCRSSNPEGRALQQARTDGGAGPAVEDLLLAQIAERNGSGPVPAGTVGAVVGATLEPSAFPLAELGGPILSPGVGAQGAGAAELAALFGGCPPGSVVANVSRSLLTAGPTVAGLRAAGERTRDEMAAALG